MLVCRGRFRDNLGHFTRIFQSKPALSLSPHNLKLPVDKFTMKRREVIDWAGFVFRLQQCALLGGTFDPPKSPLIRGTFVCLVYFITGQSNVSKNGLTVTLNPPLQK